MIATTLGAAGASTPTPSPGLDPSGVCDIALPLAKVMCAGYEAGQNTSEKIQSLPGEFLDDLARSFAEANDRLLTMIFTWWAKTPTSVFQAPLSQGEQGSGPVQFLTTHTQWYVAAVAVFGLLIAAGRLAIQRRAEPAVSALTGLVVLVVVSAVGAAMVMAASQAADSYSSWILDQASQGEGSWSATITRYTSLTGMAAGSTTLGKALPGPLTLVLALLGLITGLVQIVLMLIRTAMLGLLTGLLPLVASMASTEQGRALGRKAGGWLVAYLLYKPVAATIYAYAISALDEPNDEITKLSGFVMIILAVVALPALMRFITPLVSATTAGGAGGVAAVGMAVATGARMVPSLGGRGRSGGAGATGTPGPSGSPPPSGGPDGARPEGSDGPSSPPPSNGSPMPVPTPPGPTPPGPTGPGPTGPGPTGTTSSSGTASSTPPTNPTAVPTATGADSTSTASGANPAARTFTPTSPTASGATAAGAGPAAAVLGGAQIAQGAADSLRRATDQAVDGHGGGPSGSK